MKSAGKLNYKGDLLSLLLLAQETNKKDRGISNEEIRDEALTLLLTAFDTTSLALTWTWYLLSQNPLAEEELHEEVDQVLQGRQPTLDDYPKLKFTKWFSQKQCGYTPYLCYRPRSPFKFNNRRLFHS
ncbi:cytochrome P450 [Echinicola jeungdonensis]|uniref:cytochrome P450 n=1 Tax=Echinicola jeungdonensis TaxID=709343 RepID=UPI00338D3E1B